VILSAIMLIFAISIWLFFVIFPRTFASLFVGLFIECASKNFLRKEMDEIDKKERLNGKREI